MRDILSNEKTSEPAQKAIEAFHANIVEEVKSELAKNKVLIVGMAQNPVVKKARRILTERSISFKYLEYGSYMGMWKQRLAIKLWSGWPTFPQVFIDGKLIGGCAELEVHLSKENNKI